ncbi:hypothetical protein KMP13_01660 [Epibacterium ulvae]|uniref:hypothetical protein n=1 Tax=Epibacterium ulvae TaxID=1156985 RepID=UPI001BFCA73F|nr:hypothetical protein [Epibacterium ulvae]MBT8152622.1 hypothetical protein [Epibacterium ulvae]
MTRILLAVGALSIGLALFAPLSPASADIERACKQSDRSSSRSLCTCIGRVADAKLSRSEQRKVAKWFSDPDQAQEVRQSSSVSDNRLWKRYKDFGQTAAQVCS